MYDRLIRFATATVVAAVAAIAAKVSYSHLYDLARAHGYTGINAQVFPLSVDGLILAGSLVLLREARQRHGDPRLARGMLWLGVGATLAANALYGVAWGALGVVLSAWPAVAFVGCAEMLMGMIRRAQNALRPEQIARATLAAARIESELAQIAHAVTQVAWRYVRIEQRAAHLAQWATQDVWPPAQDEPGTAQDEPADPVSRAIRALRITTDLGFRPSGRKLQAVCGLNAAQLAEARDAVPVLDGAP